MWSTAVPDWRERIRAGASLLPTLPLFKGAARQGVDVFNRLRLPDVPGNPTNAVASADWFRDVVRAVFGSYDPKTRKRMIREFFLLVPKKNNKTTGGAHIMLTGLLVNERPNAEFYLLAPTQMIASNAYNQIEGAIALDPYLGGSRGNEGRCYVQAHKKTITDKKTGATLAIRSFDPAAITGIRPAGTMIDETHVVGAKAEADRVIRQIRGGMISQPESFLLQITTQSERPPTGVFKAELARARDVRDGKRVEALLALLYEFPEDVAACLIGEDGLFPWEHPETWSMVNPNFGRSTNSEELLTLYEKNKSEGIHALRGWASQHLNIEIGDQMRDDAWVGAPLWCDEEDDSLTLDGLIERSDIIIAGIDDGGKDDILSAYVIGRDLTDPDLWLGWGHSFADPIVLDRRKKIASLLTDCIDAGELTFTDVKGGELKELLAFVARLDATGKLVKVGVDLLTLGPLYYGISDIGISNHDNLDSTGKARLEGVSQGYRLGGALFALERKLASGTFRPAKQRLVNWAVSNAKIVMAGNGRNVSKEHSGDGKIDPFVAALMAADQMAKQPRVLVASTPWDDDVNYRMTA